MSGLYGKLPAHGDFVTRGITVPVRRTLDLWLTKIANVALPKDGLRGQIMLGPDMWLVLIVASRDRLGRRFPLALMCPFAINDTDAAETWCNAALAGLVQKDAQDADKVFASIPSSPTSDVGEQATDRLWFMGQPPAPPDMVLSQLSSD